MGSLFDASMRRAAAGYAPLVVRVLVGVIIAGHGLQKLPSGPTNFGQTLAGLGVPVPMLMGYVVTFLEIIGGILLIVGLLSRLAALLLTIDLTVAIVLVNARVGFLSSSGEIGVDLPLALIAGFLVILLAGPGKLSIDHALGYEGDLVQEQPARPGRSGWRRRLPF